MARNLGDGYCDDDANNEECEFDKGDCCLLDAESKDYCKECICKERKEPETCEVSPRILGDSVCDDRANIEACEFDKGDCCLLDIKSKEFCKECLCKEIKESKDTFISELKKSQEKTKERFENAQSKPLISFEKSKENKQVINWADIELFKPEKIGLFTDESSLEEISQYIDWSPFFWTWEMKGTYPKILESDKYEVAYSFGLVIGGCCAFVKDEIWNHERDCKFWL